MPTTTTRRTSSGTRTSRNSSTRTTARSNGRSASTQADQRSGLMKLFIHQVADLYYVERQLLKVLPRMADKAMSPDLAKAFTDHAVETEKQMDRLEQVFELLDRAARGKRCEAMDGILDEAKELMEEFSDDPALDAALVCAAQKVEHYEIATYGSAAAYAEELGLTDAAELLGATLTEERNADELLTELAEGVINSSADESDDDDDDEDQ